jgi:DNA-binding XRE family transcriptional regulator
MLDDGPMLPAELRQWRERTGYTQAAAADRFFKVTRTTLQNWEAGATPIPGSVKAACQIWGRRVRQEDAATGPVILIYTEEPISRGLLAPRQPGQTLRHEQYATNAQAIARVCSMSMGDPHMPFIMARDGTPLWDGPELQMVVTGDDKGAPTQANLLRRCADAVKALADDARRQTDFVVGTGGSLATESQRSDRLRRILELAMELDDLALKVPRGFVTHYQVDERLNQLRQLGKFPTHSLVSNLARSFVALEALPPLTPRSFGSIHPSEIEDFETELRRRGRSPDEFILSTADPTIFPGGVQSTRDLVVVRHHQNSNVRGYSYMTWVTDFIRDLDAGAF